MLLVWDIFFYLCFFDLGVKDLSLTECTEMHIFLIFLSFYFTLFIYLFWLNENVVNLQVLTCQQRNTADVPIFSAVPTPAWL